MYYSSTHNQVPKHKVRARVKTTDGESFYGSFFLSGDQRIKDLLCSDNLFIPFLTSENEVHIFNRKSIASVVPLEFLGRSENRPAQPARAQTSATNEAQSNGFAGAAQPVKEAESFTETERPQGRDVRFEEVFTTEESAASETSSEWSEGFQNFDLASLPEARPRLSRRHGFKISNLARKGGHNAAVQFATWTATTLLLVLVGVIGIYAALEYSAPPPSPREIAANYNQGIVAYQRGDYETAREIFQPLAEAGHVKAQLDLGHMHEVGLSVSRSHAKALSWYRKAAQLGNPEGQTRTGLMYRNGKGTAQDYVRAYMWFSLAATQGHAGAAQHRADIARKISYAEIAEAQEMEREWLNNFQTSR